MPTRQDIIDEARTWVGTPWAHQQAIRGVGVDCVGFIAEVAKATGAVPDAEFEKNYRRQSSGEVLLEMLRKYELTPIPVVEALPADLFVTIENEAAIGGRPARHWHVVVLSALEPYPKGIHAGGSRHGVVEHRLDAAFMRRVHSAWRLKGLAQSPSTESASNTAAVAPHP